MTFALLRLLATATMLFLSFEHCFSQDIKNATVVDGSEQTDITFGPTALARPYTTREAAKWGIDFIASPSRAADRRLFFAYRVKRLPPETLATLLDARAVDGRAKPELVAFVNVPLSGPLPVLGGDKAYYGTPYFASPPTVSSVEMQRQFSQSAQELAPRIVAVSALKSVGIAVSGISDEKLRPDNVESYVAVTNPLPGIPEPDMYFIMAESSWSRTGAEEARSWGFKFAK